MKKNLWLVPALLLVSLGLFFTSCQQPEEEGPEPVSVKERIEKFLDDLNDDAGREDIYKQLHPDIRNPWKDSTTWETTPFNYDTGEPFDFEDMDYGDDAAEGTFITTDVTYNGDAIGFELKEDEEEVWYIDKVEVGGVQFIPEP